MQSPTDQRNNASQWTTIQVANLNLQNFALPGRQFYPNDRPYEPGEYARKLAWLGEHLHRMNADIACFEEVWDEAALVAAASASGLNYAHVLAPGAEQGAEGTPRVGLATRLKLTALASLRDFPAGFAVEVPEIGTHQRFERPVLHAQLLTRKGTELHVLVVHLKSKRPKFLSDASGNPLEDRADPRIVARATLRSLIMRGAESAALRVTISELLKGTRTPLILAGDLNDNPGSVTSQIIAATGEVAFDRGSRDVALWHAPDVQTGLALRRDVGYSHIHQGSPEILDQIWVSEEFVAGSRFAIGDVRRVDYFNDHLNEGRDRTRSDHGFVRALLRLREGEAEN
ncbi:MAG: hypothetical protein RJA63_959 [Pseudomonadota bacterium]|jgi:endonuclease/exonuclease/phosphatase family metal-dependent hydrolase